MNRDPRTSPPGWPYAVLILAWALGTAAIARQVIALAQAGNAHGSLAVVTSSALAVAGLAQSMALFYLLGFLAKSATYLVLPGGHARRSANPDRPSRHLAVLYLTAGDTDWDALDSLLRLDWPGPRLFLVHDDGDDPKARAGIATFLEDHPDRAGWQLAVWHRAQRLGGKAGALNWVLERLDPQWELLLLCDSDSRALDPSALTRAEAEFDEATVAVVQFRNVASTDPADAPFQQRLAHAIDVFDVFAAPQSLWGYVPFFGHNALVRIADLRRFEGLTPGFFSDDLDFSVRLTLAGRRIIYRRDIVFGESHPTDFAAFRKRARKWALGCMQVIRVRLADVVRARRIPFAHRIGLLEFMGFYPAQALLILGLLVSHLLVPWLAPSTTWNSGFALAAGVVVLIALFSPTLVWSAKHGRLHEWPAFAWSCALVYGGSIAATARGVLDGLSRRERRWIPTNIAQRRPAVPTGAWAEAFLGLALAAVPWYLGPPALAFPASYLFIAVFLFAPITFAAYRATDERPNGIGGPDALGRVARTAGILGVALVLVGALNASAAAAGGESATARGAQLFLGDHQYQVRGIHYSPWPPGTGPDGRSAYPGPDIVKRDLERIQQLGANTILIQDAPGWLLDQAHGRDLSVIYTFTIAWSDTSGLAFQAQADRIVAAVDSLRTHRGILAWILGNEIPPWVVEQLGRAEVEGRLHALAVRVRADDPGRLLGHANWPPTKDLNLGFLDLVCFNLYPAWPYDVTVRGYGPYLREVLAPIAAGRPLLITEFGINTLEASEARQAQVLNDCWREIAAGPAVGGVVFEWADEWWKNFDNPIPGKGYWERRYDPLDAARHDVDPEEHYGIVRSDRTPKPAYAAIRAMWDRNGEGRSVLPWLVLACLAGVTWVWFGFGRRPKQQREAAATRRARSGTLTTLALLALPCHAAQATTLTGSWANGDTLSGANADDQFGWALAGAGDLNGDHFGDVAVGARFFQVGPDTAAGAVYIYIGAQPNGTPPLVRLEGRTLHEHFGESLAGDDRDIDGDGFVDLAVGAPLRSVSGNSAAGAVEVFRGAADFSDVPWATLGGEAANDWFGQSLAVGDVDGDGKADMIVGAPYSDRGGSAAGAVFIYRGAASPPTAPWKILVGEAPNDHFGWSVAYLGDANGDGYGDVLVGARLHGLGPKSAAGEAYLFYGGADMDTITDGQWSGEFKDDWFGNSVAGPGDVDGGGRPDLLVGSPYNDRGGSAAGAAYLFRGEDPPGSPAAAIYVGESANAQFGWSVAGAGDVDGDGYPDIVAGARLQASGALSAAGRMYLFRGGTPLFAAPWATADGEAADDWFGNSVGGGTGFFYPNHGVAVAGAPYNDAVASAAGRAYALGQGVRIVGVDESETSGTGWAKPRAWPNPAGGTVRFRWTGPSGTDAAFQIFDASGRHIRSVRAASRAGERDGVWDLRDDAGRRVASGIYWVRVRLESDTKYPAGASRFAVMR